MDEKEEFKFILEFIEAKDFDESFAMKQLTSLWFAFCLHRDEAPDTGSYDCYMLQMWEVMQESVTNPFSSTDYEVFYNHMSRYLV